MCFEDFAQSSSACHAKANGIAVFLGKSLSYLGIYVSLLVFRRAEQVSRRLQQRGIILKAAMDAVSELREYYVQLRTDESWEEIWKHVISKSEELDLETPQLTRVRRPPQKLEQTATVTAPFQCNDVKTKHKIHYLQLIDLLVAELDRRFDQPGMSNLLLIERVLTGKAEPGDVSTIVRTYENFIPCKSSLQRHLESLKELCGSDQSSLSEVFKKLRDVHEKKLDVLFKDVIMIARIYMACPVTSVECERSFSAMRRLNSKDLAAPSGIAGQGGSGIRTPSLCQVDPWDWCKSDEFFGG